MEISSIKTPVTSSIYNNQTLEETKNNQSNFDWNPKSTEKVNIIQDEVEKMVEDINSIKEKLDKEFTMDNLMEFKKTIKSFLDFYIENGLSTKDVFDRNEYGIGETMTVVKKIQDNLVDLEDSMILLGTKSGHLEMLQKIGEIEGLLLKMFL